MMSEYKSKCQAVTCAVESEEAPAEEVVDASGAGADDEAPTEEVVDASAAGADPDFVPEDEEWN